MQNDLLIRILMTIAIIAISWGIYQLINRSILHRASMAAKHHQPTGKITILYFTTPECAPCRTVQRPVLNNVQRILGEDLTLIEIDAQARPEIAHEWGVLSVPTTFILDRNGKPIHVNHGVTSTETLIRQFKTILS